jgi:hypothetical protein
MRAHAHTLTWMLRLLLLLQPIRPLRVIELARDELIDMFVCLAASILLLQTNTAR